MPVSFKKQLAFTALCQPVQFSKYLPLAKYEKSGNLSIMKISPERLKSFKELYKELYGIELSDTETYKKASTLLHYGLVCMKPLEKVEP